MELAAAYAGLASRLMLLDAIGLWRDDAPGANWIAAPSSELPGLLFDDPTGEPAQATFTLPEIPMPSPAHKRPRSGLSALLANAASPSPTAR